MLRLQDATLLMLHSANQLLRARGAAQGEVEAPSCGTHARSERPADEVEMILCDLACETLPCDPPEELECAVRSRLMHQRASPRDASCRAALGRTPNPVGVPSALSGGRDRGDDTVRPQVPPAVHRPMAGRPQVLPHLQAMHRPTEQTKSV